ncbi:hypothetical protein [Bacillus sp. FJAT-28004]|uniref:hypothetical protein n=1 Tax=Bacillus sp. FJAT-28004 TaxID=1679165 RepID=UPI000AD664FF|nr:hypothetical protein [Bacillus sp. FJAT-28004]
MMQMAMDFFAGEMTIASIDTRGLRPEEMTLSQFLSDPAWIAQLDPHAKGESKGMFELIEPDGKKYRGGWIGKFRSPELAKRDFHKDAVYYSIHRGSILSERILADYPKVLTAQRGILAKLNDIHLTLGTHLRIMIGNVERYVHYMDIPLYCRVSMREFVWNHQLVEEGESRYGNVLISGIEQMAIALEVKLKNSVVPNDNRPHFFFGKYEGALKYGSDDTRIRFMLPQEINQDGFVIRESIHEGVVQYNAGSTMPAVRYAVEGAEKTHTLYPSQFIAIKQGSADWDTVQQSL